ncbi:hypothetical protein JD844_000776 [Phrynosoma platyrhinos]|uniref:Zinc finger CW-type PWWP domain protein 1 n=1 Tax=Phrynosoma platyrhinos TaxID=52577 RepID=A0ABQ7T951_PHRPL|nr:hypothetical protein JD844_000776 [Phrynosoma platyrhinos]
MFLMFSELKKMSKKVFAPPVAKSCHVSLTKAKLGELPGEQKDPEAKGISALLSHAAGDGVATKHMKAAKPPNRRPKRGTNSTEEEPRCKNNLDKTKEEGECCYSSVGVRLAVLMDLVPERFFGTLQLLQKHFPPKETLKVSLATKKGVSRNKREEKSKALLLEAEREHEFRMKKPSKLSASKNRKGENNSFGCKRKAKQIDEKPEADNGGCKENRKGAPKKKVQGNAPVVIDLEEMQQEEKADGGSSGSELNPPWWFIAWAQCSYPNCEKWRRLSSDVDPLVLPEDWSCSQNPDRQYNSCSIPEETCSGSEDEVVYALYFPGSLVWAKQYGYPWWPGIIEPDPDSGDYLLFSSQTDLLPSKYHVTFFGNSVTRAWISASMLRNFGESNMERSGLAKLRRKDDKRNFKTALKMAKEAEQINIQVKAGNAVHFCFTALVHQLISSFSPSLDQERIRMFGFHSRFSERASPQDVQDHVTIICTSRAKKRAQGSEGENKNPATLNKSQEKLLPGIPVMKPDVNSKKKIMTKCFRKSFSVPQHKNNKAKHLSSCTDSSATDLALSSYPNKRDSLNDFFPMAESKDAESLEETRKSVAFDQDGEETFSSQEMDCSKDFSLVLFED